MFPKCEASEDGSCGSRTDSLREAALTGLECLLVIYICIKSAFPSRDPCKVEQRSNDGKGESRVAAGSHSRSSLALSAWTV